MPKHRWHKFKAFIGDYIDPDKANELNGDNTDIDGKVKRALNLLKEGDGNYSKGAVADLIHEFHRCYQSLYARYTHLVEELRKKAHGHSDSSGSDTDDSPMRRGKHNGKVVLKQELETALSEVADLKQKLAAVEDEKRVTEESLELSRKKIDEMSEYFQEQIDAQNVVIHRLEEDKEELLTELEMMKSTSQGKQPQISQKLRITEQLLGVKEESKVKRVDKLRQEQKLLEERITMLSGTIDAYSKDAQQILETETCEKVNDTSGIDPMRNLEKLIRERNEKIKELERKLNEKDKEILSLCEDKRESIRQLCI
ncbi:hypothetical protein ABFS82_14G192700 [Erythranthe guttata]|uniref:trichohyalin-like n=1 Tax=Erythranthe guttata TaxID=4155 RepID=UPI00064DC80F|nr:PREDICTED: trichohyalin-like [Erythranthe guttata]|eukprot:XP_012831564.1 PREDICTED: trichohyalin-like [Erythranthe guttata]